MLARQRLAFLQQWICDFFHFNWIHLRLEFQVTVTVKTGAGWDKISQYDVFLESLEAIVLFDTNVTDAGVAGLTAMLPDCEVEY